MTPGPGGVALVAGASSETGPQLCETLAEQGFHVALTYLRNREAGEALASRCRSRGVRSAAYQYDLLRVGEAGALASAVARDFGRIDVLVNLGGPAPVFSDFRAITEAEYDLMMDAHVKGYFFLAREAARRMEEAGGGVIVNISATSSTKYSHGAYGLAKACVNDMTRFLAHSFAPRVRVMTIVPGMIDIDETDRKLRQDRAAGSPLRRIVTPRELGQLVAAVCSEAFQSVTGESILADGGFWLLHR
jgi:enoyl-[acyl-carrier protein] reductase III